MIRYNKTIQIQTSRNDEIVLSTDMGQRWKTTPVKEDNPFTVWLNAAHTGLRGWQKDMIQIIHQAYNVETGLHPIELYWVYQQGKGFKSASDVALAHMPSLHLWILMTEQHTWVQESKYDNFAFNVADASGAVTDKETRDEIWRFRDMIVHGRELKSKNYSDQDYVNKGLAV